MKCDIRKSRSMGNEKVFVSGCWEAFQVEENNEMEKAQEGTEEKLELNGRPLRILVTDDSKLLRKKLRLELEKHGC